MNKLLAAIGLFALVGFADAAYLAANHFFTLPLPCSITHGCETVLHSQYSMVGPIPLALFGVGYYLCIIFLVTLLYTAQEPQRLFRLGLIVLTAIGVVMSIAFMCIQIFIIHAICQYCALSALCSFALFILAAFYVKSARLASGQIAG